MSKEFLSTARYIVVSDDGFVESTQVIKPTDEQIEELTEFNKGIFNSAYEVSGYMVDIRNETQNKLLSEYFGNHLALRERDDDGLVLTTEDEDMLEKVRSHAATLDICKYYEQHLY